MQAKSRGLHRPADATINQPEIYNDRTSNHDDASCEARNTSSRLDVQEHHVMHHRPPAKLPDPWLFDSEKLLRELDRCREMVLLIPATTHETHFAINNAISSIWNLREQLRYLLSYHREGQRSWQTKATLDHEKAKTPKHPDTRRQGSLARDTHHAQRKTAT